MDPKLRSTLESELSSAVTREREYYQVDEMKKRAITTATSYEEFKNLVACATQKPLDRDDFTRKAVVSSNKAVRSSGTAAAAAGGFGSAASLSDAMLAASAAGRAQKALAATKRGEASVGTVKSAAEFDRDWRRLPDAGARYRCVPQACGEWRVEGGNAPWQLPTHASICAIVAAVQVPRVSGRRSPAVLVSSRDRVIPDGADNSDTGRRGRQDSCSIDCV